MSGGKARPRHPLMVVPKEGTLQTAVAGVLRDHLLPDWRATHFPAGTLGKGGLHAVITGRRLKRFGLRRGWPDLQLVSPLAIFHGLELKRLGEDLTEDQKEFRFWAVSNNIPYAVAWTFTQALSVFEEWGCLRIKIVNAQS